MSTEEDHTGAEDERRQETEADAAETRADAPSEADTTGAATAPDPDADVDPDPDPEPDPEPEPYVRPDPEDVSLKEPLMWLLAPILLLTVGSIIRPDLVYDQFVYKYYWEPIVIDSGFTTVNTVSWAILMGLLLWLLVRVVQKVAQPVTFALILATVPYMMGGSMTRVFEDTGFFVQPLRYFFITPIIYVVITAVAVIWLVIGHLLKKHSQEVGLNGAFKALVSFYAVIFVLYAAWATYGDHLSHYGNLLVLAFCMAVPLAYFYNYCKQTGEFNQVGVMAAFGTAFLLYAAYFVIMWQLGNQWDPVATDKVISEQAGTELRPWVYVAMLLIPAVFVGLVVTVASRNADKELFAVYLAPLNLLLVFGQMMDAAMTSIGIDVFNYSEKHVLPGVLIGWMRENGVGILGDYPTTFVMMTIKFAVALLVVWAIDIYAKRDMERYPDLVGLAKMAIIMVGLAPGTRDAVRLAMDV